MKRRTPVEQLWLVDETPQAKRIREGFELEIKIAEKYRELVAKDTK